MHQQTTDANGMSSKRLIWLSIVAATSLGLYLLLALRYPLGPSLDNPRASWSSMVEPTGLNALWHLAIYLGLTLLYLTILRLLVPSEGENTTNPHLQIILIFATWLACSAVLMKAASAGESHDIFDYIFRGRMMVEYRANPLVDVPDELEYSIPYARYLAWHKNVDTYGPVWEASSAAVAVSVREVARWLGWWDDAYPVCPISPESCRLLMVYIIGYRMLAILLTALSGWLIFSMIRHSRPWLAPLAPATWLLSPMTLIATALGGHNDAVMLVLILLCWWLLQRQSPFLALMALILAAHVKLTALIWLPACIFWIMWRWGRKHALKIVLVSAVSGLVLSWLLYVPFGGWQVLPRMLQERSAFLANSLWRIMKSLLIEQWDWRIASAHQLSVGLSSLLFAAGALLVPLWVFNFRPKRWRGTPIALEEMDLKLWRTLTAISMLYLLVGSFWFQHWYVLWAIAPAALLPEGQFSRSILPWLSFGALSSNVAMDFLLNTVMKTSPPMLKYISVVVIIWGPLLLTVAVLAFAQRAGARKSIVRALSY
ncbi:MAG TPA: hypothetical protein VFR47_26075 [Anaerolineales bacterium]|nr:hypothetical protein [Anaerolineales bacterium]